MSIEAYELLAPVYDEWQHHAGSRPLWRFALPRLERCLLGLPAGPAQSYVDFACGTGGLLLELRRRRPGWRLAGVDGSPAMLQQAQRRRGADAIQWRRSSFGEQPYRASFDGAGCFADALNHLEDESALRAAVAGMAAALRPGGRLAFDVTNACGFATWWQGRRTMRLDEGVLSLEHHFDAQARSAWADVTLETGEGPPRRARVRQRWFTDDEVAAAVRDCGLRVVELEDWAPFDGGSRGKTWVVAERPGAPAAQ